MVEEPLGSLWDFGAKIVIITSDLTGAVIPAALQECAVDVVGFVGDVQPGKRLDVRRSDRLPLKLGHGKAREQGGRDISITLVRENKLLRIY